VIAALCDELVAAGHDVTLFGAGSSETRASLVAAVDRLDEIDPEACRAASLQHTAATMCRRYLDVYEQLRQRRPPILARV
jgi:hypothetical protein